MHVSVFDITPSMVYHMLGFLFSGTRLIYGRQLANNTRTPSFVLIIICRRIQHWHSTTMMWKTCWTRFPPTKKAVLPPQKRRAVLPLLLLFYNDIHYENKYAEGCRRNRCSDEKRLVLLAFLALAEEKKTLEEGFASGTLDMDTLQKNAKRMEELIPLLDEKSMRWLTLSDI